MSLTDDKATTGAARRLWRLLAARGPRGKLVRAGIALALVAGLVFAPSYLASLPGYIGGIDGMGPIVRAWATSTHAEAGCESCHERPGTFDRLLYRVRSIGGFYASLLSPGHVRATFAKPTDEACLVCHSDLRTVSPEGDLRIPHRAHVSILKVRCVVCHAYLVHTKSPAGRHTPPMSVCMRCHNGDTAKNACSTCHTAKDAPASHRGRDWLTVHAAAAVGTQARSACAKCHGWAAAWCANCHSQKPRSHTPDWRGVHGRAVAANRGCEACHASGFCIRCHGELPRLNLNPAMKLVR